MCTALREIMKDDLDRRYTEGMQQGRAEGGWEMLVSLVKSGLLSVQDAAGKIGMSVPEFRLKAGLGS